MKAAYRGGVGAPLSYQAFGRSRADLENALVAAGVPITESAPPPEEEKKDEWSTGAKVAVGAAAVGAVGLGAYALTRKGRGRGMRENPLMPMPEGIRGKPLKGSTKVALGVSAGAVAGALLVGGVAWATSKAKKSESAVASPALPDQILVTSADSGKTFAVKPGTMIGFSFPGTGWDGSFADNASGAVQSGEGSGPFPVEGGQGFLLQAVTPGTATVNFGQYDAYGNSVIGGILQYTFVVAPSR